MKLWRLTAAVLLVLVFCLTAASGMAEEAAQGRLGEAMPDFSVKTIDGGSFTLSEALAEKKAVLINLWATWCPPCEMEFPFMEAAYEQYQDRVEIIALSIEPDDSDEVLAQYAEAHGMTFPIANDADAGLADLFVTKGIPTTILVDRFGNVALIEIGAQPSVDFFSNAFDILIGDDYTETRMIDSEELAGDPVWLVYFYDQNGAPVPGCIINFCSDTVCTPVVSNGAGLAIFQGPAYAYHLQVIKVPEGYEFDTSLEFVAEEEGGGYIVTVMKQ